MRLPSTERALLLALAVGVLAVLPYLNGLHGDFTFDDPGVIRDNPMITGEGAGILPLFTAVYNPGGLYRPLTMVTYLLNARWGGGVVGYHVVNVLLHAWVSIAVVCLVAALFDSAVAGTVAGALFAVHPVHTEAVSGIVGRAELLAALLVCASLLAFLRAIRSAGRRPWWLTASAVALALGCLSKESAFVGIPLCLAVYLWVRYQERVQVPLWTLLPLGLVGIIYLGWRQLLLGSLGVPEVPELLDNPLAHVPLVPRLETAVVVGWEYLSLLLAPLRLSADYSFNEVPVVASIGEPRFVAAAAVLSVLVLAAMLTARRAPALLMATAFIAVPLSLTANVVFPIGTIKAERLLYLPSCGFCMAVGWAAMQVQRGRRRQAACIFAALVLAFACRTWVRNWDWSDNLALFKATVATAPHSAKAHHNLAAAYEEHGEFDAALAEFHAALAIYPPYEAAAFGIGRVYEEKGMEDRALEWYERATALNWHLAKAHLNAGAIRYRRGEYAAAEASFRAGLESDPRNPNLLIGLSLVRLAEGDRAQAQALVEQVAAMRGNAHTAELVDGMRRMLHDGAQP